MAFDRRHQMVDGRPGFDAQKRGDEDALKPRVVAERLGLPPSEVSRVKRSIAERVMKHLGRS